ncbi:bifunctional metallophosphatase/5'-nucleotidase [Vibrio sp. IRLE0018]|uniref:bifunctional metallophosphatase/5'-nucleotidase n=1 Tax=Vibrio floridensis TaxID=2908007 RepID=UPI001F410FCD|nr:bifunctional UDP-sugar hydrolase/5'-nucleotidase [Vibrio floridensis]MCF8777972.1 bifunctional metallophosphatase/5'-nucleotidase [Vibrio floridensis]
MKREKMTMIKTNKPVTLKLAHINDTHSYFEPTSLQLRISLSGNQIEPYVSAGGFARIATRAQQIQQEAERQKKGFLFLHAGDCFQGTLYFSLFKGKANADLLNTMGIDAMALGNHELDMGNEPVAQFVRRIQFPLLAGNWNLSNENPNKSLTIKECKNIRSFDVQTSTAQYIVKLIDGEPVAIFGLSLDKMADIANPDLDTPFENAIETAKATVARLNQEGINKIILLSHLGYDGDIELANEVSGIALIIGGHSHRLQGDFSAVGLGKDDDYGLRVRDTYIVQAGFHALTMGHCEIRFAADGLVTHFSGRNELLIGRRMFLDPGLNQQSDEDLYLQAADFIDSQVNVVVCKKDPGIQHIMQNKYIPRVRELQKTIIAHTDRALRHVRIPDEVGPSELAPMVAASFVHALNKRQRQVQFAIHNAGGVRNSLNPGNVSVADVAGKLLPFAVPIGCYDVQGKTIAAALEGAINNATNNGVEGTGSGSYPYTYGLRFHYCAEKPKGERIEQLEIQLADEWHPIEEERWYRGASSAYTMKGKEGYEAIRQMKGEGWVSNLSMADCFIEYLSEIPYVLNPNRTVALGC